jgi:hypothetical protein
MFCFTTKLTKIFESGIEKMGFPRQKVKLRGYQHKERMASIRFGIYSEWEGTELSGELPYAT